MRWKDKEAAIRLLENKGSVDPNALIAAAKDPAHPCHNDFTWDVQQAARERWRDQARKLIRRCNFEIIVDEVTMPVVQYVASNDETETFTSVPKIRSKAKVSAVLTAEIAALHGQACRTYGIAVAKQGIVGAETVGTLRIVRDQLAELRNGDDE